MTQVQRLLAVAAAQLGYREGRNNENKYGAWYGMDQQPWCMMFISWCAAQAGIGTDIIPKLAYVPYAVDFFRQRDACFVRGSGYIPQPGDLIFYGNSSHAGIVESCNGVTVVTIEGNTSSGGNSSNGDGVYRRQRALSNSWIMAYAHPAYDTEAQPQPREISVLRTDTAEQVPVQGFVLSGRTYVMLRDMEKLAPLTVSWDEEQRVATVSPRKP